MFDYGKDGNMLHYNQPNPPQYELNNFPKRLPTAFFTGGQDYLGKILMHSFC
jgi:lysosomal acid lipase/cholesteryl ester hydrolase